MSRIYLNTQLNTLKRKDIFRITRLAFTWCKRNMGVNNRKHYLPIFWLTRYNEVDNHKVCGEYDDETNEIFIYYKNISDVRELIETVIHEWQHQLQPMRTKYFKYKGPYVTNPFEREAHLAETAYTRPLWDSIKPRVNRDRKRPGGVK